MSALKYSLVSNDDVKSITVLVDGEFLVADNLNPNFNSIVAKAIADDADGIAALFDTGKAVNDRFEQLTDRAWVAGNSVFFDGDPVNDVITEHILRFLDAGEDFGPLVAFLDKVSQNPNQHSRENLYRWLAATKGFTIDYDGNIVGYKGVIDNGDGSYRSISSGKGFVNGEAVNGQIKQEPGDLVTYPRSEVQHDPSVGCSVGLHVGTWEYASGFAQGAVLLVKVNPRDVVSVPVDASDQKMRVCAYEVLEEVDSPLDGALYGELEIPEAPDATIGPKYDVVDSGDDSGYDEDDDYENYYDDSEAESRGGYSGFDYSYPF